jgi:hypothetical protein
MEAELVVQNADQEKQKVNTINKRINQRIQLFFAVKLINI